MNIIENIKCFFKNLFGWDTDDEDSEPRVVDGFYNGDTSSPTNETIERWQRERDVYLKDPYEKDLSTGLVRLKYNPMGICTSYTKDGYKLYEWHRPETDPLYYSFYPDEKPSYTAISSDMIDMTLRFNSGYCNMYVYTAGGNRATYDEYAKSESTPYFDPALRMWRY